MAFIFGVLTLTLAANQVATGLALSIFGLGLSSLIGAGFVGIPATPLPELAIPGVSDLPLVGPLLFGHDALVYLSLAAVAAVAWRSEEHTSELQSLMRISYAVFCLKKKTKDNNQNQIV